MKAQKLARLLLDRSGQFLPSPRKKDRNLLVPTVERESLKRAKQEQLPRITNKGLQISLGDRWAIVGMTRSGKTTFGRRLLQFLRNSYPAARVYVLDTKQIGDFDDLPGRIKGPIVPDTLLTPGGVQVWQPPENDIKAYDQWLKKILGARKPAIVFIDELLSLGGRTGNSYPQGYNQLQTQGAGLDIGVISLSQEAAYIPRTLLGQTTHLVRFALLDEHDALKVDKYLRRPKSERGTQPPRYSFYYRRVDGTDDPLLFTDFRDFFSKG